MIKKAVLPVAGLGTRCLPASKAIPKEMITIVDKPVIQYVVEEAVHAGIKEIILITHSAKSSIENHFDQHFELESQLKAKGKWELLAELRHILPEDVTIISIRQPEPRGLGNAIACARPIIADEPFIVMLPDVIIKPQNDKTNDLAEMIRAFQKNQHPQIMVANVPHDQVYKYGIVDVHRELAAGESAEIFNIIEKPAINQAPSNLAVIGRYILPPQIFDLINQVQPGADNEIQLTDAINLLRAQTPIDAYRMHDVSYDCGSKLGYLEAILAYATCHPQLGQSFRDMAHRYLH